MPATTGAREPICRRLYKRGGLCTSEHRLRDQPEGRGAADRLDRASGGAEFTDPASAGGNKTVGTARRSMTEITPVDATSRPQPRGSRESVGPGRISDL